MTCGVGRRCGSDLALLWLWCRTTTVLIGRLGREPPYALVAALKRQKIKKKKNHSIGKHITFAHSADEGPCDFFSLLLLRISGMYKHPRYL